MRVVVHQSVDSLGPCIGDWRALAAGRPFHSPDWLLGWWQHYQSSGQLHRELFVVTAEDSPGRPVLICPWYLERSRNRGRVVRWLGDEDVCTDHQTLIGSATSASVAAIADCLLQANPQWDLIELVGIDAGDVACNRLSQELRNLQIHFWWRTVGRTWSIALPATWDEYLSLLSKSHRKQIRQLCDRVMDTSRCRWHAVESLDELDSAWPVLIDLHQRRQRSLGRPGCFAKPEFASFHREMASILLRRHQLQLGWLELDNEPIAAEYHLIGQDSVLVYQGGIDPQRLDKEPGSLANIFTIRNAIAQGFRCVDFLRGDEPYKAHWRAVPTTQLRLIAAPNRVGAEARAVAVEMLRDVWHVIGQPFGNG